MFLRSIHEEVAAILEKVKKSLPKSAGGYVTALDEPLLFLSSYAAERKATELEVPARLQDISKTKYTPTASECIDEPMRGSIKVSWKSGLWNFSGTYVLNLSYFTVDYGDFFLAPVSIILAKSRPAAEDFLNGYYFAEWKRSRNNLPCVLDHDGSRIPTFRKMDWKSIYLPEDMTRRIKNEIESFFKGKSLYDKVGLDWKRGIMLAGKPGNGKTAICRAVATTVNVPVVYCTLDKQNVFDVLEDMSSTIRANAPCVSIFEDADALGGNESLRSNFLNMLDGLLTANGVLTIASTNCPEKLDEALTGRPSRFDSFYIIGDPEPEQRHAILKSRLGKSTEALSAEDIMHVVEITDGFSAASVQEVAVDALLNLVKKSQPITRAMLEAAVDRLKKHLQASKDGCEKAVRGSMGF